MTIASWTTAALLLAGALLFVLPPLWRPPLRVQAGPSPLAVYREQRAQLDAELAQGALTAAQHAGAIEELQGRVIEEVGEPAAAVAAAAPPARQLAAVLAVALLLPAGALALYALLGKPAALESARPSATASGNAPHTMSREQMEGMVEQLAARMQQSPQDAEGWHMLARSYVAIGRLPEAAQAYDRAATLDPRNATVLADYADTLAMVNGRSLDGRPTELVLAALQADPRHAKSLSLAGTAAFNRGDFPAAAAFWQRLQAVLPPQAPQADSIAASIAQAQAQAAAAKVPVPPPVTAKGAGPAGAASVEGTVVLADGLKARLAPGATLYVFARTADGPRMPLAIVKVGADLPYRFLLDDALAMTPQAKLSGQNEVILGARISRDGNATPQPGDLMGTLGPVKVGARNLRLVIDQVMR